MDACVGIDVAKATLAVALVGPAKPRQTTVDNTAVGHQHLLVWLSKQHVTVVSVCLEATGSYGDEVAQTLFDAGYHVCVVNPVRIKAYADSRLARNKTDQADALVIAHFAQSERPAAWTPLAPAVRDLRSLLRHRDVLSSQRQAERNRQQLGGHPSHVAAALAEHLTLLDKQLAAVERQIREHIDGHPDLKREHELLDSIIGIGSQTAASIVAETGGLRRYRDGDAVAAYAGLTPRQFRSGSSVHRRTRLSKIGNSNLRTALYMPAVVARHRNPVLKAFADRLQARGLAAKAVIGAVMRKLLVLAYGVVKSGVPFDAEYQRVRAGTAP